MIVYLSGNSIVSYLSLYICVCVKTCLGMSVNLILYLSHIRRFYFQLSDNMHMLVFICRVLYHFDISEFMIVRSFNQMSTPETMK